MIQSSGDDGQSREQCNTCEQGKLQRTASFRAYLVLREKDTRAAARTAAAAVAEGIVAGKVVRTAAFDRPDQREGRSLAGAVGTAAVAAGDSPEAAVVAVEGSPEAAAAAAEGSPAAAAAGDLAHTGCTQGASPVEY